MTVLHQVVLVHYDPSKKGTQTLNYHFKCHLLELTL